MSTDGSGFVVGPATAAGGIELIALLGAGGEGEVWQARVALPGPWGVLDDPVAVKVARHDAADERWSAFVQLLMGLRHPGLVRVRSVFIGPERHRGHEQGPGDTHRYVVMDYEPGLTLSQWLHEHPDATRSERIRLLHQVAAALDALHAGGADGEPVAHGDIKPNNVIVRADGTTVLVDLGLSRSTSSAGMPGLTTAYGAPELLRPDAQATTEADRFAFFATTAQALTGLPLPTRPDGYLSVPPLARQLRTGATTRHHPLLARHITRTLAAPTDARPGQLTTWLHRPNRQLQAMLSAVAVLLLIVGAITAAAWPSRGSHLAVGSTTSSPQLGIEATAAAPASTSSGSPTPSRSTSAPTPRYRPAKLVATDRGEWDLGNLDCDPYQGGTVAGTGIIPIIPTSGSDLRNRLIGRPQVGVWHSGLVPLTFTVSGPGTIHLRSVEEADRHAIPPPDWMYQPTDIAYVGNAEMTTPCASGTSSTGPPPGTGPQDYAFRYDPRPDRNSDSLSYATINGWATKKRFDSVYLRPNVDIANIDVWPASCAGNYTLQIAVTWNVVGSDVVHTFRTPKFTVYGKASGAKLMQVYEVDGRRTVQTSTFAGSDRECSRGPGVSASRFPNITRSSARPSPPKTASKPATTPTPSPSAPLTAPPSATP